MLKLSTSTLGCPGWTLAQIIENAAAMGFDAVDFRGLQDALDITTTTEFTTDLAATKRLFADAGLAISGIAISARYALEDGDELSRRTSTRRAATWNWLRSWKRPLSASTAGACQGPHRRDDPARPRGKPPQDR